MINPNKVMLGSLLRICFVCVNPFFSALIRVELPFLGMNLMLKEIKYEQN